MKRVQFHLPEKTIAALRKLADDAGVSVAEIVRKAVDAWLRRKP